jgi:1-deoxy-D-xylulose-5-phosphate synthase
MNSEKILDGIEFPADLKKIPEEKLPELCQETRDFLIRSVSETGGHFGSNLGVVELTVALHRVFDTPKDHLIWDVGHQAYAHKILTGRKNRMNSIRQKGGLTPFPKREESEYDVFGVGHSSTSISAAIGLAQAKKDTKNPTQTVAIIGDGALGGGMAFEALNHAGDIKSDILVILNDNKMSISPNVGAMEKYLTRLISSPGYVRMREKGREILGNIPAVEKFARRVETHAKGMVTPGTLFEELGFEYYGPIDGHDVLMLAEVLENLKKIKGPRFLHIITQKGKGYAPAEKDRVSYHAVKPFKTDACQKDKQQEKKLTYTDVFSDWIVDKAEKDKKLQAITPAMCAGSGLLKFGQKFPARYYDVGIAEQHSLTLAAGLAVGGKKPVVAIYSSFLQRAYDQLIHDIAIQNLDVLLAIDRAGVVGEDGATHNGSFDLSFLRMIPNLVIMVPSSESECYAMLEAGYNYPGPVAVRYPRGSGKGEYDHLKNFLVEIGKAKVVREGKSLAILAFGAMVEVSQKASQELNATLIDMRFVKPLDKELLKNLAKTHKYFVTVEDNVVAGGAGSAVSEFFARENIFPKVKNLGLPDEFLPHGKRVEILSEIGLSEEGILEVAREFIKN